MPTFADGQSSLLVDVKRAFVSRREAERGLAVVRRWLLSRDDGIIHVPKISKVLDFQASLLDIQNM
jgi:hypothetical protein